MSNHVPGTEPNPTALADKLSLHSMDMNTTNSSLMLVTFYQSLSLLLCVALSISFEKEGFEMSDNLNWYCGGTASIMCDHSPVKHCHRFLVEQLALKNWVLLYVITQ